MPKVTPQYRAERRAQVLAAARSCFIRNGFHAASMQDLVEEAGMSSGAVYRYFPSKGAVIEAIATENLAQVVAVIGQSIDEGASPSAAIATVLEVVTSRHAEDGFAAIALLVWSEALRNPALAAHLRDATASAFAMLTAGAEPRSADAVNAGKPASDEPGALDSETMADLLLCVLPGYLMRLALGGPKAIEHVPRAIETVLATPAQPPAPKPRSA
jgi:AcrR family transcriptional regulator